MSTYSFSSIHRMRCRPPGESETSSGCSTEYLYPLPRRSVNGRNGAAFSRDLMALGIMPSIIGLDNRRVHSTAGSPATGRRSRVAPATGVRAGATLGPTSPATATTLAPPSFAGRAAGATLSPAAPALLRRS